MFFLWGDGGNIIVIFVKNNSNTDVDLPKSENK